VEHAWKSRGNAKESTKESKRNLGEEGKAEGTGVNVLEIKRQVRG